MLWGRGASENLVDLEEKNLMGSNAIKTQRSLIS